MKPSDKILEAYIEKVLRLQQEHQSQALSPALMQQVAQDLGLSREDLDRIDQRFQDHLQRGVGFARYQDWNRAIEELQQAIILKPLHIEALYQLAEAHYRKGLAKRSRKEKKLAEEYAERCLQSDPRHEAALHLLAKLRHPSQLYRQRAALWRLAKVLSLTLLVFFLMYLAYLAYQASHRPLPLPPTDAPKAPRVVETDRQDIPITLLAEANSPDFYLNQESSFLRKNGNNFQYQLRASLINQDREIEALRLALALLDAEGKVRYEEVIEVIEQDAPEVRPGDAIPISFLARSRRLDASITRAQLRVDFVEAYQPEPEPEPAQEIRLDWETPRLSGIELAWRERYQTIQIEPDFFTHYLVWEYENTGEQPIQRLKVGIKWLDKNLRQVHEEELDVIEADAPLLQPSQRRVIGANFLINLKKSDYLTYEVHVLAAE